MQHLTRRQTALYLAFLVTVWGANWPLSKFALQYSPPILFAGFRTFIAAFLLIMISLPNYRKLQLRKNGIYYLIAGLLNIALFYGLQTIGLQYLPAGIFSAIVFVQPVLLGIASWFWLGEKMNALKMTGLILGFGGVAVISSGGLTGGLSPEGILLALGSAVSWCLGTVFMKKTSHRVDIVWMTAMQQLIGSLVLIASGLAVEEVSAIVWNAAFISDMLFISVFVIAIGWLVFFRLVGSGEASKVGSFTFLIPLIALIFSAIFLKEPITLRLVAGLLLVLSSILLVNAKVRAKPAADGAARKTAL
ncbi:DMT family transporter [Paenibacillus beijingensis]|uniref:Membrane protein n=1 Tax=Paenibacillus beijingensis TaxID=1126833 RepID=A0A0D5NGX6_9BACL|nr:DMT family transporter [Paenibacillus beijingensis]AJY74624.1 membrane protein [Paenibacillus beijingensis]